MPATSSLISHKENLTDFNILPFEATLKKRDDLSISKEEALNLLHQLAAFEEGRFLLQNKGLNGFMTAHIILHAQKKQNLMPLQHFLIHDAPVVKATRERFWIFQEILQTRLASRSSFASIPCGLMDDLFLLNTDHVQDVQFTGIDLDPESISLAKKNAAQHHKTNVHFEEKDAWQLATSNTYDVITSNGLNIYEKDDDRVIALYKQFYSALKPGGILITSFLTPPPQLSPDSPWKKYNILAAQQQKIIFFEIIGVAFQTFRTENQTRNHLMQAGFKTIDIRYDLQRMFPTVIAQK